MRIGLNPFQKEPNAPSAGRFDTARAAAAWPTDNIIFLSEHRRGGPGSHLDIAPGDGGRASEEPSRLRHALYWSALFGAALLLHSAVIFAFLGHTKPQASVGLESISVEIVLGAQTAAGLASAPSESETAASEPAAEPTPPEPEVTEKAPETLQPAAEAEALKRSKPADKPRPQKTQPKRTVTTPSAPTTTSAPASSASSGIGQGRSSADSNYLGLVAAHLAKHKRFPPEASASGSTGVVTITFAIDGQGHFIAAQIAQTSGVASLDAETQDMVRRASPFPPPPSGQTTSFTVPVNFNLRQ